jgi:hypothetical protein
VGVHAEILETASFAHPFTNLKTNWNPTKGIDTSGTTLKLTKGYPGDAGAVWGKSPVNLMEFSAVLEVSVDGPGTDNPETSSTFAMFVSDSPMWKPGNGKIAGSQDSFTGFAVQIHLSAKHMFAEEHKEVRVLVSPPGSQIKYADMVALDYSCKVGFALEQVIHSSSVSSCLF